MAIYGHVFMRCICPNMVIMPLYGHVNLISICKLDLICINSESRHVIVTQKILVPHQQMAPLPVKNDSITLPLIICHPPVLVPYVRVCGL